MTRQPAVYIDFPFKVTGDALLHVPYFVRQPVQVLNLAVALLAGYLFVDMPLMVEEDVLRQVVDLTPGGRGVGVEIFMFLLNPGMLFDDVVMAVQTQFHRRQSWKIGVGHVWVAILALNLFDTTVDVVAERYGLFRPNPGRWRCIKQDQKCADREGAGQRDEQNYCISFQRVFLCYALWVKNPAVVSGKVRIKRPTEITMRPRKPRKINIS